MKLWKKVTILCSTVLIIVVAVCFGVLLKQMRGMLLSLIFERTIDKQAELYGSFDDMMRSYSLEEDSKAVEYSLAKYCFAQVSDTSAVLMAGEDILYSQVNIAPNQYLALDEHCARSEFFGEIDGRHILIVGSAMYPKGAYGELYGVYIVEDITPVYEDILKMFGQCILIGALCIGAGLLAITILVRRFVQPVTKLQIAAARIAAGSYDERVSVKGRDEVGMLAADFNRMAEAIEGHIGQLTETARRQQLFMGGVTHEFKTPLTTLILSADTLQDTYMDEEERITFLVNMKRQCKWLERLVQKMLKLITQDREIEQKWVLIPELFDRVRESTRDSLQTRGISLETQCKTERLMFDPDLMQSVLVNLVDNAGKASSSGQTVVLAAYENVLEVTDSGIGIPQEELEHITEPFYMVDKARSKKNGGVGLGLTLVREIVKAHGAELEIESVFGSGTTVRVRLPR